MEIVPLHRVLLRPFHLERSGYSGDETTQVLGKSVMLTEGMEGANQTLIELDGLKHEYILM